jgi:hypothetical protein
MLLAGTNVWALPSFARQTGQRCSACHIGGNWPQLTPWGRFFKLAGYTPGKQLVDKEGVHYVPAGVLAQGGITWVTQPNNALGQPLVPQNAKPEAYGATLEVGTKITDFLGMFYEYGWSNNFPGWTHAAGPIDIRAVHFFHPAGQELLVGVDMNNDPSLQDVWNTVPSWSFPFYASPQSPGGPGGPMIGSLAQQAGGIGAYALFNRAIYVELSMYRAGNGFFRWMTTGTDLHNGANYLEGYNPYWRAYWTKDRGPNVFMVGTYGMHSNVYPDSSNITRGSTDVFADTGFDTQYQRLGEANKFTLRASYTYEQQRWSGSYPLGNVPTPNGNFKNLNLNGAFALGDSWTFTGGYFVGNGSNNSAFYSVTDPNGNLLSSKPNTTGYVFEVDRTLTQNIVASLQYTGFTKFNGLKSNVDGMGRAPSDNNSLWLSVFFAF